MMMSRAEADAIAVIVHGIRRDWDRSGVLAALAQLREQPLADVAVAAVRAAQTPTNRTPAVIPLAGPHWPASSQPATGSASECAHHPGEPAHNCRCCNADRKAATVPPPSIREPRERPDTPGRRDAAALIRTLRTAS